MSSIVPSIKEELIQEEILRAALELFQKYGLYKVTMDDIAKSVGKSRSSLYYYYKNRDEVFDAVLETILQEIWRETAKSVDKAHSTGKKIRAFCIAKIKTTAKRKALFSAMEAGMNAEEISTHTNRMTALHKRLMKWEADLIKQILSEGAKKGEIRPLKKKEQELLIFVLLSSIRGIRREMSYENDFSEAESAIDLLVQMTLHML